MIMHKFFLVSLILLAFTLSGCMGLAYKLTRFEESPFAPELVNAYKKNIGLDTTYNVKANTLSERDFLEKTPFPAREYLSGVLSSFENIMDIMSLTLVNGYVMDVFLNGNHTDSTLHLLHVNYGGDDTFSSRNKPQSMFDVWQIGGRTTKIIKGNENNLIYDADVEQGYELEYYENGNVKIEFRGTLLNNTSGIVRHNGSISIFRENGKLGMKCDISDFELDQNSCSVWDENGNLK